MPILNYTTKIEASKTIGEIQGILSKRGVRKMIIDYDEEGSPIALTFSILLNNQPVGFSLPCRWEGVQKAIKKSDVAVKVIRNFDKAQAIRVAWRIIKDWVEAQMAIIDAELATLPEVFLPYAITRDGETLYQHFENRDNSNLLLTQ